MTTTQEHSHAEFRRPAEAPLRRDVRLLGDLLGAVITEQVGADSLALEEDVRQRSRLVRSDDTDVDHSDLQHMVGELSVEKQQHLLQAFSLFFQLVNLAEQVHRIRRRRWREHNDEVPRESLADAVNQLQALGLDTHEISQLIEGVRVELVLTAHPTEATRRGVLAAQLRIAGLLRRLDEQDITPRSSAAIERSLLEEITTLWQSDNVRSTKPTVADEIRHGLWFFEQVLIQDATGMLSGIHAAFPEISKSVQPLAFGSWIGGDQDGNPNAGPETLERGVLQARRLILEVYRQDVRELARVLSVADHVAGVSDELITSLQKDEELCSKYAHEIAEQNRGESYRRKLSFMWYRLGQTLQEGEAGYSSAAELQDDLHTIEQSLREHAGQRIADGRLATLQRKVSIFGFRLVTHDVRVHAKHVRTTATAVVETLEMVAQLQSRVGASCIELVIVSGTESSSDILTLQGLIDAAGVQAVAVPLFETVDDLDNAPAIVTELLDNERYRQIAQARGNRLDLMVGYSDSAKDGSFLTAQVQIHAAQRALHGIADAHGLHAMIFHGRGGSTGRGGGPTHAAIMSQPQGESGGWVRMTEQGETISFKYGLQGLARRNIEAAVSGSLLATGKVHAAQKSSRRDDSERSNELLAVASRRSREVFRSLVYETTNFVPFMRAATPVDELSLLNVGSRPAKRVDESDWFSSLRAIPWIFGWTQNRSLVPAWYGVGSGIEAMTSAADRGLDDVRALYESSALFRTALDNVEMTLAKASFPIARLYFPLAQGIDTYDDIVGQIEGEYARTVQAVKQVLSVDDLLENKPTLRRSIALRNPYVDPMNIIQIEALQRYRECSEGSEKQQEHGRILARSIVGIASALRNTG